VNVNVSFSYRCRGCAHQGIEWADVGNGLFVEHDATKMAALILAISYLHLLGRTVEVAMLLPARQAGNSVILETF
jgi:hypothetical protein